MKFRVPICLVIGAAILGVAPNDATAQRRGTGTSSLTQTPGTAAPVDQAIDSSEQQIMDAAAQSDADLIKDAARENAQDDAAVLQERDDLTAEEAAPRPPGEGEPLPTEEGIDNLPADLPALPQDYPPFEDELPPLDVSPSDLPDPNTLIPDDVYVPEEPPEAPPAPAIAENKFQKDRLLRVRYEEVKLQALKDTAIRQMRERADTARTDEDKRAALREYYTMLFDKMVSIDPELQDRCDLMEKAYLRRVGQYRVEPTIPLNPPPTPEPLASGA